MIVSQIRMTTHSAILTSQHNIEQAELIKTRPRYIAPTLVSVSQIVRQSDSQTDRQSYGQVRQLDSQRVTVKQLASQRTSMERFSE